MSAILLKDVPPHLHTWLKREAARNRRSMHQQALACLEQVAMASSAQSALDLPLAAEPPASLYDATSQAPSSIRLDGDLVDILSRDASFSGDVSALANSLLRTWLLKRSMTVPQTDAPITTVVHGGRSLLPETSSAQDWLAFCEGEEHR